MKVFMTHRHDVAVAMNTGTQAAKEAGDMIDLDEGR